ncbi:hypothetical protein ATANTOWER_008509 [Ataeniobius toweri]|uniref:Uncharacterized protein n=1 Tax=Ataeniobius toweri TaxID=208326 RepID=A0ABU7AN03_9TELE|nr:hypothetical protein [Ataeniobius toweri]
MKENIFSKSVQRKSSGLTVPYRLGPTEPLFICSWNIELDINHHQHAPPFHSVLRRWSPEAQKAINLSEYVKTILVSVSLPAPAGLIQCIEKLNHAAAAEAINSANQSMNGTRITQHMG